MTLLMVEGCLSLILFALAFSWPRIGNSIFTRIENAFRSLARRRGLSVLVVGLTAICLRLAMLPIIPIPLPFVPDDFSFLLAAQTFASGRLTNPTPAMWVHFETIHVTMVPTYMSMYFPAQGLVLAAAKVLTGQPWFGVLLMGALMCAALCWMLQAWLPAEWALLGGMIAVIRLALFSYWMNTYSGGGSVAALGGALVLGSLPRLTRTAKTRYAVLLALGMVLMGTTRPYESMLMTLPVAAYLLHWLWKGSNRPSAAKMMRIAVAPLLVLVAGASFLGYYDYRAFGHATTLPYTVDRAEYAMAPYYIWQQPRPEPLYRHEVMRHFYYVNELKGFQEVKDAVVAQTIVKGVRAFEFYAGILLLIPLIMVRRIFLDRRIRFLLLCVLILTAGMMIEIFFIPHYIAPFTAAFYAIGLQMMRHLRVWKPGGQPVGRGMVRMMMVACVLLAGMRVYAGPLHLRLAKWPPSAWADKWYGPDHFGTERAQADANLNALPGKQLAIVRYSSQHNPFDEWVYNAADIDGAKVVWAREMDTADNLKLLGYYKDRQVWLVQPDQQPVSITPYPKPMQP